MITTLTNVRIRDLLAVLNQLAPQYDAVDIIIDTDEHKVTMSPIDRLGPELNDNNIYKLI